MGKLKSPIPNDYWKKTTQRMWLFLFIFDRNKKNWDFFFIFPEKHCPCTHFFWAGRKEPQSGGGCGAGYIQAVFQWVLVLVIFKSLLSNLSHRLKLTANTIRNFLWLKYGAQGTSFAQVQGFLKCQVSPNQLNTLFLKLIFDYKK